MAANYVPALTNCRGMILTPPLAAFLVGFLLYYGLAKLGWESEKVVSE